MKKVLLVTGSLNLGGLETVAMQIVRILKSKEYSFDFLVYGNQEYFYEREAIELGCRVLRIPRPQKKYFSYYRNLKNVIQNNGPYDIVHSHVYFNSSIVLCVSKRVGVPLCIAHSHSRKRLGDDKLIKKMTYLIMRKMLNRYADIFIACSDEAGRYVFGERGFSRKGKVIVNPVDVKKYAFSMADREKIRASLGISQNQIVIGQVSRIVKGKNQKFLIDLFFRYQQEQDAVLLIVGDGELRQELEEYVHELHISEKVRFTGNRKDVPALLSAMDIFVMTSLHEGLGIVIIEALANGLCCLCEKQAIVEELTSMENCVSISGYHTDEWIIKIEELKHRKKSINSSEKLSKFSIERFQQDMYWMYSQIDQ